MKVWIATDWLSVNVFYNKPERIQYGEGAKQWNGDILNLPSEFLKPLIDMGRNLTIKDEPIEVDISLNIIK